VRADDILSVCLHNFVFAALNASQPNDNILLMSSDTSQTVQQASLYASTQGSFIRTFSVSVCV